ncbi:MAG: transcriptional regulator, PaaX family, partial [Solirubrobacterales bacterium]|nr:transcriptional regulator, PaaX family [Solirubrobacterales bacterium]
SMTSRADELMAEGDRRIFSFGRTAPATDIWTVLWHAIPETRRVERSRFASRLRFLGFGSVQDATWVAARNREQEVLLLLRELDIEAYASVLVGRLSRGLPPVALVAQAWDLEAVKRAYEAFVDEFGVYRTAKGRKGLTPERAFVIRTLLLHRFRGFPFADPELPESISDAHELRGRVVETFDDAYAGLAGPAEHHFRAVAQPAVARAR